VENKPVAILRANDEFSGRGASAFPCAKTMSARANLTALSFEGGWNGTFPGGLWFSGHLLCFEHFLCSATENRSGRRVHNAGLSGAVNI
jgi:hypothetical protein